VYKFLSFLGHNKFSLELTGIAVGGVTLAELAFADLVLKVLIGVFTLTILVLKTIKDYKK